MDSKVTIIKEKIQSRDPRLKRHVYHDSRSKNFAFNTAGIIVQSIIHNRHIPILDQGQIGSCTGNAGIGALATDPLFSISPKSSKYTLNESGAIHLYSDAEMIDGDGPFPPNDNGSCGLSIAKALQAAGIISSYQHTFTLDDALKALTQYPILVGIKWYEGMMNPDHDGRVHIRGQLAGGHEIVARQIDAPNKRVWFDNSWGTSWGVNGRFYLTFDDFGALLSDQGDVTVLIPNGITIPTTTTTTIATPVLNDDATLAVAMKAWLKAKGL